MTTDRDTVLARYGRDRLQLDFGGGRIGPIAADLDRFDAALADAGPLDPTVEPGAALRRRLVDARSA